MSEPKKPRLAEILGVEVNQDMEFGYTGEKCWIDETGMIVSEDKSISLFGLVHAINYPESIVRFPKLTEVEKALLHNIPGIKWISRDKNADDGYVDLWGAKPELLDGCYNGPQGISVIGRISCGVLISVNPGDCIEIVK